MNKIEKELNRQRIELDNIEVPDELEASLRKSLNKIPNKKSRFNPKLKLAAVIIVIILIGYNANTLADYGKQLIGFDNVMNGTLKELNRLERGQIIDKSSTLEDGNKLTLDGIMLDDNNLVVFYSIYNPNAIGDELYDNPYMVDLSTGSNSLSGSGQGEMSEDGKEIKWIMTYDAPKSNGKDLKLTLTDDDGGVDGEIDFEIDESKAMGKDLKINIGKTIEVPDSKIRIKSLVASPISTIVKGEFKNIFELVIDQIRGKKINFGSMELELIADGKIVEVKTSSFHTNMKGSYFDFTFDALPKDTQEIEVKLKSFDGSQYNETIYTEKIK